MIQYLVGDTREVIATLPDASVDLVATSPPFLALRSYVPQDHVSKHQEIGSEANPAEFIDMLLGLTAEWGRVLAAHGSIAIELGDTYAGSGGAGGDYNEGGLREGQGKVDGSATRVRTSRYRGVGADGRSRTSGGDDGEMPVTGGTGWPRAKSLALIPQLYAVALAYGINPLTGAPSPAGRWLVRNVIVWHRPNPAVGALGDKVRPSTSYIVVATRSPKRWFDLTAVRGEPSANTHARLAQGVEVAERSAKSAARGNFATMPELATTAGAPPLDAWFDTYDGTHDTWTLTTQPSRLAHYAMWPAKLAERLILSMCPREVCRVCGEPRRRIEGAAEYQGINGAQADGIVSGRGRSVAGLTVGTNSNLTRKAPTLGWTDCGCLCPTCNGRRIIGTDYWSPDAACPDCTNGRALRRGLVLDPFAGSGTTCAVADLHGRDAIGIDFDARNKAIYPARYDEVKRALYGTAAPMPGQETFDFAI